MERKIKVLLVEDHEADRRLVEEAIADCRMPVQLESLHDGEQAINYIRGKCKNKNELRPDLIILDLNMPRKGGHEFLEEVHEFLKEEEIPVVLLTVSDNPEDINKALDKRMNYYLSKPVNSHKLQQVLTAISELWAPTPGRCCSSSR